MDDAAEALRHGLELARLALKGPDPQMAEMYLADAIAAARESVTVPR